jgi:hypothetical protein
MQARQDNEHSAPNSSDPTSDQEGTDCPFLVPVTADRLWVYPVSAYCRRPDHPLRVPASNTLEHICTDDYSRCPGYQASHEESDPDSRSDAP